MAEVDDLMAEVGENSAKGGRCRGRHHPETQQLIDSSPFSVLKLIFALLFSKVIEYNSLKNDDAGNDFLLI
jgi:hypothetical protein